MEKKKECKTKKSQRMKFIFYCVGNDAMSGLTNSHVTWKIRCFSLCVACVCMCVFTTAVRKVDNKFIFNTKGKCCCSQSSSARFHYYYVGVEL